MFYFSKAISLSILILILTGLFVYIPYINKQQAQTAQKCLSYLPFSIWEDPQQFYYYWYGLVGTNIKGTKFQTGHAFQRHIAVRNQCTLQQKQQNKTFQKTLSQVHVVCDIPNRTTFTYNYDGKIASASNYIQGIDCRTGQRLSFSTYFIQFKRAIPNPYPKHEEYLNSNYVTIWTFYPKRLTSQQSNQNQHQNQNQQFIEQVNTNLKIDKENELK